MSRALDRSGDADAETGATAEWARMEREARAMFGLTAMIIVVALAGAIVAMVLSG